MEDKQEFFEDEDGKKERRIQSNNIVVELLYEPSQKWKDKNWVKSEEEKI